MKKTALLILLALSVIALAACSKKEETAETTAAEVTEAATTAAEASSTGTTDADAINAYVEALEVVAPASLGTITNLGQYTGLELSTTEHVVITDEEVDEYIAENILPNFTEEVTDAIKDGDVANIDFEGKKDGVAFDGGTSTGYDLTIGSGSFIDGFESGLIGKKAGDTVDLNLTFPEDYSSEELAGQDVVFTVKINSVTRQSELSDAVAQQVGDYQTVADLKKAVKEVLQNEQDLSEKEELYAQAIDAVVANSTVEAAAEAIEYTTNSYMKNYAQQVQNSYGVDLGYLLSMYGYSIEEFIDSYNEYAAESVKQRIVLQEIAKKENLSITDDDIETFAQEYGYDSESLKETVGEDLVNELVLEDKANKFIIDNSTVTYTAADAE